MVRHAYELQDSELRSPDPLNGQALPSLFTILTEQLGLKLQASTAPVPVLVIERVEAPTPD